MTEVTGEKRQLLTGKSNYLGWSKIMKASLATKKLVVKNEAQAGKSEEAVNLIMQNLSLSIAGDVPDEDGPIVLLDWLKSRYGDINRWDAERDYKDAKMIGIDGAAYLAVLDTALAMVKHSGGKIDPDAQFNTMLNGCHQEFYKDFIQEMRKENQGEITKDVVEKARVALLLHYKTTPLEVRQKYSSRGSANNVEKSNKRAWVKRNCDICAKENPSVAHTHDTQFHRKKEPIRESDSNKAPSAYFDTGADQHYFTDKPKDLEEGDFGSVETAGGEIHKITGKGTWQLGSLHLNPVFHVPTLKRNLVAATPLLAKGVKVDLNNKRINMTRKGKTVLDSEWTPSSGLIRFGSINEARRPAVELHNRFGHLNSDMIKKTLLVTDVPESFIADAKGLDGVNCESCLSGKRRAENVPKRGKRKVDLLEEIQIDIQGPFPVTDIDGNNSNVKIIDKHSGYLKFETIKTKTAKEMKETFKRYKARMERRTGKLIKTVLVDGGGEFDKEFIAYTEECGIVKLQGAPYRHHIPPMAEKVNESINTGAKAIMISSKLPKRFYSLAQAYMAYLHNRTVHSGHSITPYQYVFGRKPSLSQLQPFGAVGFAFVPSELRNKLEPVRERVRLLGYGDDDDSTEMRGYYVLCEKDLSRIYVTDVIFDSTIEPTELDGNDLVDESLFRVITTEESTESEYLPSPSDISGSTLPPEAEVPLTEEEIEDLRQEAIIAELNSRYDWNEPEDLEANTNVANSLKLVEIPVSFRTAMQGSKSKEWFAAMQAEVSSLKANGTWKQMHAPAGRKTVKSRWHFRVKTDQNGDVKKYKARLVAKGFTQVKGIDYKETFAPTAKMKSVRTMVTVAAKRKWKIHQDDVPSAYLKPTLEEEIYMQLPEGFNLLLESDVDFRENYDTLLKKYEDKPIIVRLLKTLYGLKQSGREWNKLITAFLLEHGFTQSCQDPCIFFRHREKKTAIVGVYVDDILTTGNDYLEFRQKMQEKFKMEPGGLMSWYLGMQVKFHENGDITMDQDQYLKEKFDEYKSLLGPNPRSTPFPQNYLQLVEKDDGVAAEGFPYREMIGSLMYAMVGTRPDLAFPLQYLCQFMHSPKKVHCELLKHVYNYCQGNSYALTFKSDNEIVLKGWADASYANNHDGKSTSGYCFKIGNSIVSWSARKQNIVALSTTESETIGLTYAAQEAIWLKELLLELGYPQQSVEIFEDNQACIKLAMNPQQHSRTKHIQVRYFFIRQHLEDGTMKLTYCSTKDQLADIFTKNLAGHVARPLLVLLGLTKLHNQGEC